MHEKNEVVIPYLEMGGGFMLGLAVGYALKKSFKILLILFGLGVMFVFLLESQDMVSMNDQQLQNTADIVVKNFQNAFTFLKSRMERYGVAGSGSALVGFLTGMKFA